MGHFPPVSDKCYTSLVGIFLPFLNRVTYDYGTFSSCFWKVSHMTIWHFPPISEKCNTWLVDIFLLFLKSVIYDNGTISSHFWKVSHMTIGHFPPVSEKCHIWPWDIFLPFLKSVTEKYGTFSSHFRTGGKCPIVMCYTFQKQEENVHYLCVTIFWEENVP